ncbi:PKD domain-containing protein [Halapricum salinum]|uniref:PKD domain-containing protein n=1 Tax=Halapricum salinum TaxID=1457250 RepID=A0A4D6HE35_9EURY|nr:PKD domain-containing protein [Halapricum salinum]QCC51811.1 PKD domain-containing protein [Halapricum salinum]
MGQFRPHSWLLVTVVFVAVVLGSTAVSAAVVTTDTTDAESAGSTVVAECTASPTEVNIGETVTLDASNSDASFIQFDKEGDGQYERGDETDFIVNVTYSEAGTYQPQAQDDTGDVDQCGEVYVNSPPSAAFTWRPDPGVAGQPVEFDASNSVDGDGEIVAYHWDWDGDELIDETTDAPVVNETFFQTGFRNVGLTVEDDGGSNSTTYRDVEIVEATVIARCSVEPQTVVVGQNVTIDASASENASYLGYDFGDGTSRPETVEFTVNHSYSEPGEYTPVITVYGPGGKSDTVECPTITVERANARPTAEFTWSPNLGIAGESMTFDASNSSDPDGTIGTYRWDWDGDEQFELTTDEPVVEHTFDVPGSRFVGLQVEDDENATDIRYRDVSVVRPVVARCSVEPRTVEAGQTVVIDARASENGSYLAYDLDGDGEYERPEATEFVVEHSYDEPGEYTPVITVYGERGQSDTVECPTITVEPPNEPPEASFTYSPDPGVAGETMTFDASNSVDPDGSIETYRWDFNGDGTYEESTTDPQVERTFSTTGFRNVGLQVVDDDGATGRTTRDVELVAPQLTVRCTVEPTSVEPGENVTIRVEAANGSYLDYDFDGDGEYDRFETQEFTATTSYNETGEYAPVVRVYPAFREPETAECDTVTVEEPDESGLPIPPWWPIPAAGGGLLGLGGLAYYFFGGGGGGAAGGRPKPKPKPRPHGTQQGARYETGVFEIPADSGLLSVPVGFEPDLILCSAVNGARTDAATDRTAGWSRGIAHVTSEGIENRCLTVADDAHTTDQATCAADDDLALQVVRHEADGPPGRVTAAVTDTTSDGFEVDVSVPGDDPLAGGIRVLYQAFRTGSDVDVETGTVMTPTEPGTQTIDLGIDAEHVSLTTTAAVSDDDQLWTTDRGVGFSVGHAVAEPTPDSSMDETTLSQAVSGSSAWPGAGHPVAGVGDDAAALHLLYQDGDNLAGRTSAKATALGQTLRLQYDRVYNGPHKLGSTARHPISYLALAGEPLRPAVGTFSLPRPGETRTVDCGFEPAMIECQIAPAPLGEEVASGATPHPFGASQGTAIATGDRLRQYVLHHAVVPGQPEDRTSVSAATAEAGQARASTDGGTDRDLSAATRGANVAAGNVGAANAADLTDVQPLEPARPASSGIDPETATAPAAPEHDDDGRVGLWLATDSDGTIVGRDELSVVGITETGFRASVDSVDTDSRGPAGPRPTVVYRAWPALDVTGSERESTVQAGETRDEHPPRETQNQQQTQRKQDQQQVQGSQRERPVRENRADLSDTRPSAESSTREGRR